MKTVGIVACSNGLSQESQAKNEVLIEFLESCGNHVLISNCIYEKENVFSGTAKERAGELMKLFTNPDVEEIYDISGGDLANQVLDYLDFEQIKNSRAEFWGYSDLTTVLNAIYAQTGKSSVLYQVRNTVSKECAALQQERYQNRNRLFQPAFSFIQGASMEGTVIGGNIRCFLKLAGTKYMPDFQDKILLLEAYGGDVPQMTTYLTQLKQLGAFECINGILLGTFTNMEKKGSLPDIVTLVQEIVGSELPLVKTSEIGHGKDSKAIQIGEMIKLNA